MTPEQFKQAQAELGLSRNELARAMGWSTSIIEKMCNGRKPVTRDKAMILRMWLAMRAQAPLRKQLNEILACKADESA